MKGQRDHHVQAWVRDRVIVLEMLETLAKLRDRNEGKPKPVMAWRVGFDKDGVPRNIELGQMVRGEMYVKE